MSELKVGDKVKPYGYVRFEGSPEPDYWPIEEFEKIFGIVMEIHKEFLLITLYCEDLKMEATNVFIHRKQCRKLVKKVKCEYCCGTGKEQIVENCPKCVAELRILEVCRKCNGTGKVMCYE